MSAISLCNLAMRDYSVPKISNYLLPRNREPNRTPKEHVFCRPEVAGDVIFGQNVKTMEVASCSISGDNEEYDGHKGAVIHPAPRQPLSNMADNMAEN